MNRKPLVSVITVNYNQATVTADLLRSLASLKYQGYETIVVDNASAEPAAWLKDEFPFITYVASKENTGFAGGNNLGLRYAKGDYVFFINNDTEVTADLVDIMVDYLQAHPKCGMASPKIRFFHQPETIQYAGSTTIHLLTSRSYGIGSQEKDEGQYDHTHKTGLPHGAAMMVPMPVINKVGPMSEGFFLYYEEMDWAARIEAAGYETHYVGTATIYHKESVSTGRFSPFKTYYLYRNRLLYIRRNRKGWRYLAAAVFFLCVSVPIHAAKHLLKGEAGHAVAIVKAVWWNIVNPKVEERKLRTAASKPVLVAS